MDRVVGNFVGQGAERDIAVTQAELEERFLRFVAGHRERARRMAWRLVGGDEAVAEDITQEAFLKAYAGLAKFRQEASFETWFFRILVRQAQAWRRWRRVRNFWGGTDAAPGTPEARFEEDHDPRLRDEIEEALGALTDPQRQAFVLVHLEGFTVRETAEVMGKAEGTVKSHLHRALVSLRGSLADYEDEERGN
jgi:RNA polymerase sigma factor (sigma-70 family)